MFAPCANSLFLTPYRRKSNLNIMKYNTEFHTNTKQIVCKYCTNTVYQTNTKRKQKQTKPKNETIYPKQRTKESTHFKNK